MTEWHGIKVGGLYKRTGKGSRGVPLAMVVSIENWFVAQQNPIINGVKLITLEAGKLQTSWLSTSSKNGITVDEQPWPYKEVV